MYIEKNIFAKKLLYYSKNRGFKENELILGKFAAHALSYMTIKEMKEYETILQENDVDLYEWLTHKSLPPKRLNSVIMQKLLKFNFNQ